MKNLKFRTWNVKTQRFCLSRHIVMDLNGNVTNLQNGENEYIVEQSTGLKDINEVEIYDGDIVTTKYSREHEQQHAFKVVWGEDCGSWLFDPFEIGNENAPLLGIEENAHHWDDCIFDDTPIIIGNIHKNPELLKRKQNG